MSGRKLSRYELAKLKYADARKLIAQGKSNAEVNEFIRKEYKCGNLNWSILKRLREEVAEANTMILKQVIPSDQDSFQEAARYMLEVMQANGVLELTINSESSTMKVSRMENHEVQL